MFFMYSKMYDSVKAMNSLCRSPSMIAVKAYRTVTVTANLPYINSDL